MITREKFIEATGREPQDDDLDRVNCKMTGEIGHLCCGWDNAADKPFFESMPLDVFRARQRAWLTETPPK